MASHDVFISYPSQDKVSADAVCHGLEARGVRCWIAPRDVIPGSDWQTSLLDAINDAKATVLVFTANTNSSEHIKREITAAFEGGSVVIPFRLENVTPQGALRYHLTGVHWLDAFSGELEPHIEQLASTIKRVLARPPADGSAVVVTPEHGPGAAKPTAATPPSPAPSRPPSAGATPAAAASTAAAAMASGAEAARTASSVAGPAGGGSPGAHPVRPAVTPAYPRSNTPARKGGVPTWAWVAGGVVAVLVLGVLALGLLGGDDTPAANDPAAQAAALQQQGVEIGVQQAPEPQGGSTPVPTLDGPVQPPATEPTQVAADPPPVEDPGLVDPGYVEEPVAEEPVYEDGGGKPPE